MDFNDNKPIYRQIIDYCFACIMTGAWLPEQKVPSVRELAVGMAVNTHTVLKAFDFMQANEVIYPRRGMGYYLSANAKERVNGIRRDDFFNGTLHEVFREMKMLGIGMDEVMAAWVQSET